MAMCPGKTIKSGNRCNGTLYKCGYCGNVGCSHGNPSSSLYYSNAAFKDYKCLKCGKSNGMK